MPAGRALAKTLEQVVVGDSEIVAEGGINLPTQESIIDTHPVIAEGLDRQANRCRSWRDASASRDVLPSTAGTGAAGRIKAMSRVSISAPQVKPVSTPSPQRFGLPNFFDVMAHAVGQRQQQPVVGHAS